MVKVEFVLPKDSRAHLLLVLRFDVVVLLLASHVWRPAIQISTGL